MTNSKLKAGISGLVVALLMCFVGRASAAETPQAQLVHAYLLLKHGNHDYEGHRVAALEHVAAAAKELGIEMRGDSLGGELQRKSDEQLRIASDLLRECRSKLAHKDAKVLKRANYHVILAVKEIDEALKVK